MYSFGIALTGFVLVNIGVTLVEIKLLFSNSQPPAAPWLLVRAILTVVWTVMPMAYIAWLEKNRYTNPFPAEVIGAVVVW